VATKFDSIWKSHHSATQSPAWVWNNLLKLEIDATDPEQMDYLMLSLDHNYGVFIDKRFPALERHGAKKVLADFNDDEKEDWKAR
jgi:hypothetical protein